MERWNTKKFCASTSWPKRKRKSATDEEAEERKTLHAQYIKEFREQTEATLKRVRVEQDDGSYKPLVKKEKKLN